MPTTVEHVLFKAPETSSKISHILGNTTNLNTFKRIKIIESMFPDHMKLNQKLMTARFLENIQLFEK